VVDLGQHISLQPVTAQGRVEAFLGIGKRDALTQFDRIVASHALALLALELAKARAVSETERRLKGDVLDKILAGELHPEQTEQALHRLGFDPGKPVTAMTFAGDRDVESLAAAVEEALAHQGVGPFLAGPRDDAVLALIQPTVAAGFLPEVRSAVAARSGVVVFAGAGSLVPIDSLEQTVRESRYALQVCRTEGRLHAEFEDLGTYQLLLSLQDPDALRTFADSVLAPVDRYDRTQHGELLPSLKAFLERNARWEAAAADLLVHRHTLRYRMRKVEELTGRRLSSARDRMEFFLAIRARDLLASQDRRLSRPYNGDGHAATAPPSRRSRIPQ
jgi:purine catabolism regulator